MKKRTTAGKAGKRTGDAHAPCRHRRRETRDGVTMDWCYAIGCETVGDMPCEYCRDRRSDRTK